MFDAWWMAGALGFGLATFGFVTFVYLLYNLYIYPEFISPLRHLPGPKDHHLLIGQHINQYRTGDPEEPFMSWMRQWPDAPLIRYYEFMHGDAVLINSPRIYRSVMTENCYSFVRSVPFRRLIGDIIGEGLVFAEGDVHRSQRRALGSFFTNRNVQMYMPQFNRNALSLIMEMDTLARGSGQVEIKDLFAKATLDIIGSFAFGIDLKQTNLRDEFAECYKTLFDLTPGGMLLAALNLLIPIRWLPLKDNKDFMRASCRLREMMTDFVDARIERLANAEKDGRLYDKSGELRPLDMLSFMVNNRYMAEQDPWTKGDLIEQALNFLATGHETTAGALTFAFHLLGKHPRVVHKIRAEAKNASIVAEDFNMNDDLGGGPSFNQIDSLVYLDHVLKECLRLLPPVAGIPRVATKDLFIAGQLIPKGTTLMPVPAVIHHNPAIWGDDADEFRPERWEKAGGGAAESEYYAWVGFGHGPRACIGRALAALNVKIVLLQLATRFDFAPVDPGKVPLVNPSGQIRPSGDVWMHIRRAQTKFEFDTATNSYYCVAPS